MKFVALGAWTLTRARKDPRARSLAQSTSHAWSAPRAKHVARAPPSAAGAASDEDAPRRRRPAAPRRSPGPRPAHPPLAPDDDRFRKPRVRSLGLLASSAAGLELPPLPKVSAPSPPSLDALKAQPAVAAGAAGAGALALFVGFSALTAPASESPNPSMDKYFALGLPGGSEKLIVGRPFQEDNGNLGLWSWQKTQAAPLPKDYSKERQARLRAEPTSSTRLQCERMRRF